MPDPAKSVDDIDDVLSSIRRLVAEQPGPKWQDKPGGPGGPDGAVRPSVEDRLVLTPSLRVTDAVADGAEEGNKDGGTDGAVSQEVQSEHVNAEAAQGDDLPPETPAVPDDAAADTDTPDAAAMVDVAAPEAPAAAAEDDLTPATSADGTDLSDAGLSAAPDDAAPDLAEPELDNPDIAEPDATPEPGATDGATPNLVAFDPAPDDSTGDGTGDSTGDSTDTVHDLAETDAPVASPDTPRTDAQHVTETPLAPAVMGAANDTAAPEETAPETAEASFTPDDEALAPMADDTGDTGDMDDTQGSQDAEDGATPPRVVGDDGWRPEMRLFDWDASAETAQDAPAAHGVAPAEFESETGDANWPDETADRAVLDLAAVRDGDGAGPEVAPEAEANDGAEAVEPTDDTHATAPTTAAMAGAAAAFTPIFSRRASNPDTPDMPRTATPTESAQREPETQLAPHDTAPDTPIPLPPEPEAETSNPDAALWHTETDAFHLFDAPAPETPAPETPAADTSEATAPSVEAAPETSHKPLTEADTQPVSFSSIRDIRPDVGAVDAAGDGLTRSEQDTADDDDAPVADTSDASPDVAATAALDLGALEEQVLRRIVAEAVREELQGALGERITRNVRKLVRREIRLVLAVDELD